MIITTQQFMGLFPLLILLFTITVSIFFIAWKRNHLFNIFLVLVGLIFSFLSLYIVYNNVPINITMLIHIDYFSIFYIAIVLILAFFTCIISYFLLRSLSLFKEEFYLLILLSTIGSIVLIISHHMAMLFIGIELISIPIFGLIGYIDTHKRALEATLKYIILSSFSSTFILFGIALVYFIFGSLDFKIFEISHNALSYDDKLLLLFGLGMMIISFSFKLSLFPCHLWIADVYEGTSASVLTFLSTVTKIAVFSFILRFFFYFRINQNLYELDLILQMIAFISMIFGSLMALFQNNIKRLIGYSSISNLGSLLIVLVVPYEDYLYSINASGVYLISYCLSMIGIFSFLTFISISYKPKKNVDSLCFYEGIFWRYPVHTVMLTIMVLSLAGIPLTIGFFGKYYLFFLIIKEKYWLLGIGILLNSILGLFYYLRIISNFYRVSNTNMCIQLSIDQKNNFFVSGIIMFILTLFILILGIFPQLIINLIMLFQPSFL